MTTGTAKRNDGYCDGSSSWPGDPADSGLVGGPQQLDIGGAGFLGDRSGARTEISAVDRSDRLDAAQGRGEEGLLDVRRDELGDVDVLLGCADDLEHERPRDPREAPARQRRCHKAALPDEEDVRAGALA